MKINNKLSPQTAPASPAISGEVAEYMANGLSERTHTAYKSAWAEFVGYCQQNGLDYLPASPAVVADYIVALAKRHNRMSTIRVKLAAIHHAHYLGNLSDPTKFAVVRDTFKGIQRKHGVPVEKKDALTTDELSRMVTSISGDDKIDARNRAILLVGFCGAFRRSEIVALDVSDVKFTKQGMTIIVKRSKTDQEGKGKSKEFPVLSDNPLCPTTALRQWLKVSGVKSGKLFRGVDQWKNIRDGGLTAQVVALIVKETADKAGLDSTQFSGHSLRSVFVTSAFNVDVEGWKIRQQTGHESEDTLQGYNQLTGKGAREAVTAVLSPTEE